MFSCRSSSHTMEGWTLQQDTTKYGLEYVLKKLIWTAAKYEMTYADFPTALQHHGSVNQPKIFKMCNAKYHQSQIDWQPHYSLLTFNKSDKLHYKIHFSLCKSVKLMCFSLTFVFLNVQTLQFQQSRPITVSTVQAVYSKVKTLTFTL